MPIITLSDALIQRLSLTDRRILRDRILSGFCIRLNKRTRTFFIATTSAGRQVRITIGRWPLISTEEARSKATTLLLDCRMGIVPVKLPSATLPTIRSVLPCYAKAKGLKPSSLSRYESLLRTHFGTWLDCGVNELASPTFFQHCHRFSQSEGAAIVEVGRGLISALVKYINAIHGLALESPFTKLAAAGLMPGRAQPRERRLQEDDLCAWYAAVQRLNHKQRDLLMLLALTGLRRNEGGMLLKSQVNLQLGQINIPETKTGEPHSLPLTPLVREIVERRMAGLASDERLFSGVSLEHLAPMAMRAGAPKFMLHDLRKMLATIAEKLGHSDAIMRRILNHKAKRSDTLHRHYVQLSADDVRISLVSIQNFLTTQWGHVEKTPPATTTSRKIEKQQSQK